MRTSKVTKNSAIFKEMAEDGLLPKSQLAQSKIFGVRESTLNGWMHHKEIPEYAKQILLLLVINSALSEQYWHKVRVLNSTMPVYHNDKILLIKIRPMYTAVYAEEIKGEVICECTTEDDAAYILDFIN